MTNYYLIILIIASLALALAIAAMLLAIKKRRKYRITMERRAAVDKWKELGLIARR
jgi:hypothetical protein